MFKSSTWAAFSIFNILAKKTHRGADDIAARVGGDVIHKPTMQLHKPIDVWKRCKIVPSHCYRFTLFGLRISQNSGQL